MAVVVSGELASAVGLSSQANTTSVESKRNSEATRIIECPSVSYLEGGGDPRAGVIPKTVLIRCERDRLPWLVPARQRRCSVNDVISRPLARNTGRGGMILANYLPHQAKVFLGVRMSNPWKLDLVCN